MDAIPSGFDEVPLKSLSEKGAPPKYRITKASAGRSVFVRMREDDIVNAANRAECQDLLDGAPPFLDSEQAEANLDMPNVNWRGTEQQLERAMAPYYRLAAAPEHAVMVRTRYGDGSARQDFNFTLSEEITKTIRTSKYYLTQRLLRDQKKVKEGLGIAYFPDKDDWRFKAAGLGQFFFERQKFVCEEDQEVVCATEPMNVTELFRRVSGEGSAGWNRKACIEAIRKATSDQPLWQDWERMQDELKNNDLSTGGTSPPVRLVHVWVREFSQKWSHLIITENACDTEEFLYEHRDAYDCLTEVLTMFPDGIGTNAKIHGMRGLLFKIYPMEQQRNRSLCRFIGQGDLASSLVLACEDEEALANAGIQYFGNMAVVPPGFRAQPVAMPDLSRSVVPAIEMMERLRNDRTAGYTTENVFDGDQRKTKYEISAHLDQAVSLSESQVDLHYLCEDGLVQQVVRRMIRRNYTKADPGGREIVALRERLKRRDPSGELLKAFYAIDWEETRSGRAIGGGSAGARRLALDDMAELTGFMDDKGKYTWARWRSMDRVGSAATDELFPPDRVVRTTTDTNIAVLENNQLLDGQEIPVQASDNHLAHAREHIPPLEGAAQAAADGAVPLEEMAVKYRLLWVHAAGHVDKITGDDNTLEEAAMMRQTMQQIGEPIENGLRRAREMAKEQGQEEGGPQLEQIKEVEEHNESMRRKRETFELDQRLKDEASQREDARRARRAQVEIAIADAKGAAEIARGSKTQRAAPAPGV